jgi:hypothetical protein
MKKILTILMAVASLTIAGHGQIPMRPYWGSVPSGVRDKSGNDVPLHQWRGYRDADYHFLYITDGGDVYDLDAKYVGHLSSYSSDGRCGFVTAPSGQILKFSAGANRETK